MCTVQCMLDSLNRMKANGRQWDGKEEMSSIEVYTAPNAERMNRGKLLIDTARENSYTIRPHFYCEQIHFIDRYYVKRT